MEIILICLILIIVVSAMNILCFVVGAKLGQKVSKGENIKLPNLNPVKVITEHRESQSEKEEQRIRDINLENINNYDGTGLGQRDI